MPRTRLRATVDPAHGSDESLPGFSDWDEIGRGGDATVYRARQNSLQREVAIKVLTLDDAESVRRFTREVQLMVSLGRQHPNIANVLQIGTSSRGRPCIVMDYYELGSLDQRLAAYGTLTPAEAITVGLAMTSALSFAHGKGVLHRDVKPQNILMLPTTYVLADFGIARLIDSANTTASDRLSYRHASPQVLDGFPASESDDIWSLGATLFHLLDGQPPFTVEDGESDSALAYIRRVRTGSPRTLVGAGIPRELVAIVDRALEKDPANRFSSAAEFHDALAKVDLGGDSTDREIPGSWPLAYAGTKPTQDLTWVRLRSFDGGEPPGFTPPAARRDTRGLSYLIFGLGGTLLGLVLVALFALVNGSPDDRTTAGPATATSTTAPAASRPNDVRLRPQQLAVKAASDPTTIELTWQHPAQRPEGYAITLRHPSEQTGRVVAQPGPDTTSSHVTVSPEQTKVCVGVTGLLPSENRFGAEEICIDR